MVMGCGMLVRVEGWAGPWHLPPLPVITTTTRISWQMFLRVIMFKQFLNRSRPMVFRGLSTQVKPFPVLKDTIDTTCPQLAASKKKAEEQLFQLQKLSNICLAGGGERGIALHVNKNGKLLVRDKLKLLLDEDSDYLELSLLAGLNMEYGDIPAAGSVNGIGKIQGRYCVIICNDGTVTSGTFYPITVTKNLRSQTIGVMNRLPSLYIVDSAGGFLPLQSDFFADKNHGGRGFRNSAVMSAAGIPQMAVVCGSCTAGGAYQPSMCEDAAIVTRIGTIFLGGPPLVKAATGEDISAEDLGGATLHCSVSGVTDYFAETEEEGLEIVRDIVATLNVDPLSPASLDSEEPLLNPDLLNALSGIDSIDRRKLYAVIGRIVDGGRFREFKQKYGKNLATGYGFIEGRCVGVIGNAGPLTYQDGFKGSHFIQICQQRQLPLIFLQNSGILEEHEIFTRGLCIDDLHQAMKGRAAMMAAVSCVSVPKITINIGSCHGDDNYTMCGPSFSPNFIFSWPGACVTHTLNPLAASLQSQEKTPTAQGNTKVNKQHKPRSAFNFPVNSSWYLASRGLIDGIIIPSDTRKIIAQCLRICNQQKSMTNSPKDFPVFRL
ncbi:biotin-dependent 3-methylcrotonyl-coenzyme A carboxylase beta1 subunit isoform X2 [Procambarus clarkii]|uniref:biotin-dependent 3-methylcrotonyl-coenzyme A carboxylase beta1 subunit isoform X2 n=1 Tax=Procambarus clarkii TaxID=6728 RepID=UPI001E67192F|nr:biotin-dependent 3-methylcrotonyl-coenzyme A carboxylase beta1 subunit-like isoform X2 [Procambarus clarkii]